MPHIVGSSARTLGCSTKGIVSRYVCQRCFVFGFRGEGCKDGRRPSWRQPQLGDGLHDVAEVGLQGRAAHEEPVDVLPGEEALAVARIDRAAVHDAHRLRDLVRDVLLDPVPDVGVRLLRHLRGRDLPRADGPDGLVGDDHPAPVGDLLLVGLHLPAEHLPQLAGLALLEGLADASDHAEAAGKGVGRLLRHDLVGLGAVLPALRVPEDHPGDVHVREHLRRDLSSVGTTLGQPAVLSCEGEFGVDFGLHTVEVHKRWSANNLDVRRHCASI
mmetsp:Transcript_42812/g.101608  ORF Transcript_42812/g.101608 Transcript_42812/m.101608 type:complete len:272 (-) Transcript_42812:344-1159(-)